MIKKPSTLDTFNAWYNFDGADYFVRTDTMTQEVVKEKKVILLKDHPEVVSMIRFGSYPHKFYLDEGVEITDDEALDIVYLNNGYVKKDEE